MVKSKSINMGFLDDSLGYQLRRAQLAVFNDFAENCRSIGTSAGLFSIVTIVFNNPGLTQSAIAKALGIDRSAMVAAIDKLEAKGLIERRKTENDRRSYALFVTDQGNDWYQQALTQVEQHEAGLYMDLSEQEKQFLVGFLSKLAKR